MYVTLYVHAGRESPFPHAWAADPEPEHCTACGPALPAPQSGGTSLEAATPDAELLVLSPPASSMSVPVNASATKYCVTVDVSTVQLAVGVNAAVYRATLEKRTGPRRTGAAV
jgi:hypothetical protein